MVHRYRTHTAVAVFFFVMQVLLASSLHAQSWHWARTASGSGDDMVGNIAVDSAGNTYMVGTFEGNVALESTIFTNGANVGLFLAKYNPAGVLVWAAQGIGAGNFVDPAVAVSNTGEVFITGGFNGTVRLGPDTLRSPGGYEGFVARYSTAGTLQWSRVLGRGVGSTFGRGIALDSVRNCYVTGFFSDTARFDTVTVQSMGDNDVFVASYEPNGNFRWVRRAGGPGNDESYGIGVDAFSNSYIAGQFDDSSFFGLDTMLNAGGNDAFVAKFNSTGGPVWATPMGGGFTDYAWNVTADRFGNAYVAGHFIDTARFGAITLVSTGGADFFVAKLDGVGEPRWAVRGGGPDHDAALDVAVDELGNVYATGRFTDTSSFGSSTIPDDDTTSQIFVVKYDGSGVFQWVRTAGGPNYDEGRSIATDRTGEVRVAGAFADTARFGSITLVSAGGSDAFVARLGADPTITIGTILEMALCPGDQFQIPFTTRGVFETGNYFTAQLSDSTGNFANPISLGRVYSIAGTTIIGAIPRDLGPGTRYRVRVVSDMPQVIGTPSTQDLIIHAAPVATITASGALRICQGETVTLDAGPGFTSYFWVTGDVGRTLTVNRSGSYTVVVTNANGCQDTSDPVTVTVISVPRPIITRNGAMLESTEATTYQWSLNGTPISGATSRTYAPTQEGNYTVQVTDTNGCGNISSPFQFRLSGVGYERGEGALSVYPHPNRGRFTVELTLERGAEVRVTVVDALGRVVKSHTETSDAGRYMHQVDISGAAAGVYYVRVEAGDNRFVREVVKQ